MIKIFLIIFLPIFCFSIYSRKFSNPYKNYMIFGAKGSGKSTLMVKWMIQDLRHGWTVYTDMPGVSIEGVRFIKTLDLAEFAPPPKSSVYLDEAGLSFDNRNFKSFPEGIRDFAALQRKYKVKWVLNSQTTDTDKKLRSRTDRLFLQTNIGNVIGITRPIIRTVTLTEASSMGESRIADQLKFDKPWRWRITLMPRYFKYFNSFNPPARKPIEYQECHGEPWQRLTAKQQLSRIRASWRKK